MILFEFDKFLNFKDTQSPIAKITSCLDDFQARCDQTHSELVVAGNYNILKSRIISFEKDILDSSHKVAIHFYQTNSRSFWQFSRVLPQHIINKLRLNSRHNGRYGKLKLTFLKKTKTKKHQLQLVLQIFMAFIQILLNANLSLFPLCETNLDDSIDSSNFSVTG